jgi:hypothetical protein
LKKSVGELAICTTFEGLALSPIETAMMRAPPYSCTSSERWMAARSLPEVVAMPSTIRMITLRESVRALSTNIAAAVSIPQ